MWIRWVNHRGEATPFGDHRRSHALIILPSGRFSPKTLCGQTYRLQLHSKTKAPKCQTCLKVWESKQKETQML
jgi:hypothetical protein